ncbi:MAG: hypothetical protein ABI140_14765 [Jatrophihabitantaceae bacterium]
MTSSGGPRVHITDLGGTEQSAVRRMLDLFRDHGWSDVSNAALVAVQRLTRSSSGLSPTTLASSLPDTFYLRNSLTRKQVSTALSDLVGSGTRPIRR